MEFVYTTGNLDESRRRNHVPTLFDNIRQLGKMSQLHHSNEGMTSADVINARCFELDGTKDSKVLTPVLDL